VEEFDYGVVEGIFGNLYMYEGETPTKHKAILANGGVYFPLSNYLQFCDT
jgi:hypothetical protein